MAKITIFQDSIIVESLKNKKLKDLIKSTLDNEEKTNSGNQISNHGGYQTKNIWNENIVKPILEKTSDLIAQSYSFPRLQLKMLNLWINKNYKHNFNKIHNHAMSDFSGVYYIEVSEKDGELVFYRGDKTNQMMSIQENFKGEDFDEDFRLQPLENQLIIFPSHLQHMVFPHSEEKARISVSFNIKVLHPQHLDEITSTTYGFSSE